jgi:hypothetical protein
MAVPCARDCLQPSEETMLISRWIVTVVDAFLVAVALMMLMTPLVLGVLLVLPETGLRSAP